MQPDPVPQTNDDDYVVSLLLKDAESNRKRYLANSGLGSLLSKRPRGNAPKPNTRFLKNIIRETDSHNAALKAKEEEESRARLRELKDGRDGKRKRGREDDGGGAAGGKRRREDRPGRWVSALGRPVDGREGKEGRGEKDGERSQYREQERTREEHDSRRHRRRQKRDAEVSRSRSRSPRHRKDHRRRERSPIHQTKTSPTHDSDSDPLEPLLGPKLPPTILPRGRGAHKPATAMDSRFSPSYNPKTDVDLSPDEAEGDDWDMALEALRDRAKWRAQGAERLRDAGFTEEEVERWEGGAAFPNGGEEGERDVLDVKWRKEGEREWDRGKVVQEGVVSVGPEWGRLKGR